MLDSARHLSVTAYSKHPEVYGIASMVVDSLLLQKRRKHKSKYNVPARKLISSIWMHDSDHFRFGTRVQYFSPNSRKQVWMTPPILELFKELLKLGYVSKEKDAIPPALSRTGKGYTAVYRRTALFIDSFASFQKKDLIVPPDFSRIEFKDDGGIDIPINTISNPPTWLERSDSTLKQHFELLNQWDINDNDGSALAQPEYAYIRKFKGSFEATGRLYAPFCNWSKKRRLGVRFNGEKAASIDLSRLHPTLILRLFFQSTKEKGMLGGESDIDTYEVPYFEHLPRAAHKICINALLNSKSASTGIRVLLNAYYWFDEVSEEYHARIFDGRQTRIGQKCFPGNSEEVKAYINAFQMSHPMLSAAMCSGIGSYLQKLDSDYMLTVLDIATKLGIPTLPIHDEVIFPESYLPTMKIVLARVFRIVLDEAGDFGMLEAKVSRKDQPTESISLDLETPTNF